ncbi:MAG TPA: N-acetylmuramoyl-L-alanine amidase [Thermoanaerobaculia bacterium]|nr:N-acetylmuramoyl-L-alanine amidase [Thermoanaerobaculia bacterium]
MKGGRRRSERLKRRLVAELVQANVDDLHNALPPLRRRSGGHWSLATVLLVPLALLALGRATPAPPTLPGDVDPGEAEARQHQGAPDPSPGAAAPGTAAAADGAALPARLGPVDPAVFPLAVERVVLDPGHGGAHGGTHTPSGMQEKDLTLDIARRLRDELLALGYEVLLTREDDTEVSLEERTAFANRAGADLFVSIHVNWIGNRSVRGVETYYLGTTEDPFVTGLAARENRDSGYAVADTRQLLEELYAGLRQDSSERLARSIQRSLLRSLRTVNPRIEDRGVKTAPFIVLMKTQMPAVLAEVSCLSNEDEAELLARPLYRQYIAEALSSGIAGYAEALAASDGDSRARTGATREHS